MAGSVCAFTVDVEGFAEGHAQTVRVDSALLDPAAMDSELDANLGVTLDLLARHSTRATFFFLGRIAQSSPRLVRRVAEAGHEIGCHSLHHVQIHRQGREAFRRDLRKAKSALEDAAGLEVVGFRAPHFSLVRDSLWAVDELSAAGFRYDSSVVPTRVHDDYGLMGVPAGLFAWPNGLVEFPMPVFGLPGLAIPGGGGGYFRAFPVWWMKRFLQSRSRRSLPTVFYIHPYEIGPVAPRLPGLGPWRRLRHYLRISQGIDRLTPLLESVTFTTMSQVLEDAGYLRPVAIGNRH